ncbi:hypothetical protein BDZ45DRAFT_80736 [Acephala macrosclerotiorum]|nr:hypothetical protein BDZ45DRAFT_80736 [Acephala macrosclerotiorum]
MSSRLAPGDQAPESLERLQGLNLVRDSPPRWNRYESDRSVSRSLQETVLLQPHLGEGLTEWQEVTSPGAGDVSRVCPLPPVRHQSSKQGFDAQEIKMMPEPQNQYFEHQTTHTHREQVLRVAAFGVSQRMGMTSPEAWLAMPPPVTSKN